MEACGEREGAAATSRACLGGSGPQGEGGGGEGHCASQLGNLSTLHPAVRPRVLQEGARVLRSSSEVRRLCTGPARVRCVGKHVQNAPPRGRKATEPLWPRPALQLSHQGLSPGDKTCSSPARRMASSWTSILAVPPTGKSACSPVPQFPPLYGEN